MLDVSATTAAGVEAMHSMQLHTGASFHGRNPASHPEPHHHRRGNVAVDNDYEKPRSTEESLIADEEDLLLQCKILEAKAAEDRRARQRAEDELRFAKHKLSERDKKLEANRLQLAKQQNEIYALQKQLDDRTSVAAALKQQVESLAGQLDQARSDLIRQGEQLQSLSSFGGSLGLSTECHSRKERRGSVTDIINERAKSLGLKRRIRRLQVEFEGSCRAMESDLMYEADLHSSLTQRNLARGIAPINDLLRAEASGEPTLEEQLQASKRSGLVSYDGIRRYGRGALRFSFNEPLDLRTPHDVYIDAKVKSSSFCDEYTAFREGIIKSAKEWKTTSDGALSALWFIFNEREKGAKGGCVLQNPKEDFQKEISLALMKAKVSTLELVKSFNEGLKAVLGSERRVKLTWLKEQRPAADFGVQVVIPPPEDPRIAIMAEEIGFLKLRQEQIHEEHELKSRELEMQREKAEVNTQYLQQKVFSLHSAVHNALLAVYKHRYRWAARCPNHFAPLDRTASKKRQLEVGYNIQLGEAIDLEIKSLGQFADYFVSDQLFGVDLGQAFNPNSALAPTSLPHGTASVSPQDKENEVSLVLRRKEPVPGKKGKVDQARRLSTQLDAMLREERASKDSGLPAPDACNAARTPSAASLRKEATPPPEAPSAPKRSTSATALQPPPSSSARRATTAAPIPPGGTSNPAGVTAIRTRSQSPRPTQPQHKPLAPESRQKPVCGISPVTAAMVASLIPTTINLELDPNSVSMPHHRASGASRGTAFPRAVHPRPFS